MRAAVGRGDVASVQALLDAGTDPNHDRYLMDTSIILTAVERRDNDMVRVLLDAGADPNAEKFGGPPALVAAVEAGDFGMVQALLEFSVFQSTQKAQVLVGSRFGYDRY